MKMAIIENIVIYILVALGIWYFRNGWPACALILVNTTVRTTTKELDTQK
jgi:hypothetical protein